MIKKLWIALRNIFIDVSPDGFSGLLVAHVLLKLLQPSLNFPIWLPYVLGLVCAGAPDLDTFSKGSVEGHKSWLHYPAIMIPAGAIFGTVIFGLFYGNIAFWALLFSLPLLLHFIHDSLGFAEGIKWTAPFYKHEAVKIVKVQNRKIVWFVEAPMSKSQSLLDWEMHTLEITFDLLYDLAVVLILVLW